MASRTVDIVRITHQELENIAGNMSQNTGRSNQRDDGTNRRKTTDQMASRQRKERKRPDMAIYRPGMSRLSRRTTPGSDQSEEGSSGTEISPPKTVKPSRTLSPEISPPKLIKSSVASNPKTSPPETVKSSEVSPAQPVKSAAGTERLPPKSVRPPSSDVSPSKSLRQPPSKEMSPHRSTKPYVGPSPGTETSSPGQKSAESPAALMSLVVERSNVSGKNSNKGSTQMFSKPSGAKHGVDTLPGDSRSARGRPAQQRPNEKRQIHNEDWEEEKRVSKTSADPRRMGRENATETDLKSKRFGNMSRKEDHKEQLKVKVGGDVAEPAPISPTTVELIQSWKGNQNVVGSINNPQGPPDKTLLEANTISISKGKGPLRSDDKLPDELSPEYSPKPQRKETQSGRRRGEDRDKAQEVSTSGSGNKSTSEPGNKSTGGSGNNSTSRSGNKSREQVLEKREETEKAIGAVPEENAAEWDWVKELMNEEPPAEPKFYHSKIKESDVILPVEDPRSHDNEDHRKLKSEGVSKDRSPVQHSQGAAHGQETRNDVKGKDRDRVQMEDHHKMRDEKQGIAGGGRDDGGGRRGGGGRNDDRRDGNKVNVVERLPAKDSKAQGTNKIQRGNRDLSERNQPVRRDADRKTGGRLHSGSNRSDARETSSQGKRPERALYVNPRRAGKHESEKPSNAKDEKHGRSQRREGYRGFHEHDERDEEEEDEQVSRTVAVSPNKKDLKITVQTDKSTNVKQRQEPDRESKRYSSVQIDKSRDVKQPQEPDRESKRYSSVQTDKSRDVKQPQEQDRESKRYSSVQIDKSRDAKQPQEPDRESKRYTSVQTDKSRDVKQLQEPDRESKRYSSHRSRQRFNSGSSSGEDGVLARGTGKHDDIEEVTSQLDHLHVKKGHKETASSLRDSMSSVDSDKERSVTKSSRHPRRRYEDEEKDNYQHRATTSVRSKDQPRNESRKPKHHPHVKFSDDVVERKRGTDNDDSDSENVRSRRRDTRGTHGHRERETRRNQRDDRGDREIRRSHRDDKSEEDTSEHHPRGGGLLRLPSGVQSGSEPRAIPPRTDIPSDHSSYSPYYDKHYPHGHSHSPSDSRHKQESRARGSDKSRLWDPSKPQNRPALPDKPADKEELQFYDPEEEQQQAPVDRASPDPRNVYPSYYPPGYPPGPYYPGYPPQVPQGYYPPGYYPSSQQPAAPPPTSWAEQVDKASSHGMPITPPPGAYTGPSFNQFPPLSAATAPASDPYQVSPQDIQGKGVQSVHQQSALRMLREASSMDLELTNLLSRGLRGVDCIDRAISIQHDLEKVCEKLLLLDLDACNKYNVEQLLWKSAYYQLIETLRKQQDPIGEYKEYLMNLLEHGTEFYKGILSKLESGYKFDLENYTGMDPLRDEKRRSVKLALLSAQRCMIALGDIARYKELTNDTSNYGKARSWYLKAQQLVPRNGRPYNQLAILALYTRRKLDAVYYYMRSLAASNQFLTARESLMSLFEEVRKKSHNKEQEELRIRREKEQAKAKARRERAKRFLRHGDDEDKWRQEVWVSHDGVRSNANGEVKEEEQEEESEEAKLRKMSPVEVNKKFVLSFLNAHGKLFTNIGMEAFPHVVDKLLREFSILLKHSPPPINSTRLIQLMAINMYAAHHTQSQEPEAENMRSLQQEQAVQLGLDMFGLLVKRCTTLLKDHIAHKPSETHLLHEDLHEFLPGIKVFADWLMCHIPLWNPPPNCTEMPYGAAVDVWKALAGFFNIADKINTSAVSFIKHQPEDCTEIRLTEDLALSGFVPLMALPLQPVYVPAGTDKVVAMDCTRINSLRFFAEFLCGLEMPLLAYRKSKGGFFSVAPEYFHADPEADVVEELDEDDDVIIEDYTEEDEGESTEADRDINRLRERKEDLERKLQQQQRKKAQIEAIVDSHRHQRKMEIEIRPVYLIPDTNCFIDHLLTIQMLVSCKRYTLVVPLVVINELDGLAKGSREGQYNDPIHAYQVQTGASNAIQYLEDQFDRGNKHLRALTGKGTVMDTITFRSEESGNKGTNDDLILKCCLHYCEDKARDFMPHDKDAPIHLLREVVLLTNDRNLRVKGLNQNVPVRDIVSFIKWAKL